jgi:ABC-type branched-subunit amino acid transport system substrate-binding protein
VDNGQPEAECTSNQACTDQATLAAVDGPDASVGSDGVVPAVCLPERRCAKLLSEDCKTITGDYKDDRAILIGSLFATSGTTATQNGPRERSAILAVEEINAAGGIPSNTAGSSRPLVMVSCDVSANLERAARHLAYDVKVPAIVGPNTSQDTLDVSNKVTIQAGVVAISPTAVAASIADLRDNDMTWLMIPSDDQRAPLMIRDINDLEQSLKAARSVSTIKLSIIYRDDALGVGTRTSMSALEINGKPLADASNAGSPGGNVHVVPYQAKDFDFASILNKEIAFAPDIVILAGTAETVTKILTPLEQGWTMATRPYYYFIDPSKGPELLSAVTNNEDLRVRIRGTGTRPMAAAEAVANSFNLAYVGRYASSPTASGAGACYDAAYSIAYSLSTIKDEPINGASVAKGLRKLSGGSVNINTGTQNLLEAFQTLASGQSITGLGTNGPLEWDERGIVAGGTIEMWCIGNSGGTPVFQSSGLTFDIKTQTYNGVYTQCGP